MKLRWDNQHVRWGVTSFLVIAASMLFYYGVFHMKTLITGIQTFLGILTPIVYGVVIAFLLTPVLNFLEKKIIYPLLARVVDFIYFSLIDFPTFNVADIYVTCGITVMVFLMFFRYKEENDFDFLKPGNRSAR